jgi:UTP--glucose-1-phosphate uridylyltransferase
MSTDLRVNLKAAGKTDLLEETKKISDLANFAYIRQKGPYGNATPLLNVEHLVGNEPFIYTWGDDFVLAKPSRFEQIIGARQSTGGSILTCIPASQEEDYKRYAFVGGQENRGLIEVDRIIEKPGSKEAAPSTIASVGGYLFDPAIFDYLKSARQQLAPEQEFVFQPSIQQMITDGHKIYGRVIDGQFYDTGNKLEYLKTVVDFALMHDDLKDDFREYLRKTV